MNSRSAHGCWTCRLRRKKCDETRPECATCQGLGIECAKYGVKPNFMDGAREEKHKCEDIKRAIKAVARRKRKSYSQQAPLQYNIHEFYTPLATLQTPDEPDLEIANTTTEAPCTRATSSTQIRDEQSLTQPNLIQSSLAEYQQQPERYQFNSSLQSTESVLDGSQDITSMVFDDYFQESHYETWITESPQNSHQETANKNLNFFVPARHSPPSSAAEEAFLLMHYVEHVLYLQYPFYNTSLDHHGRKWILTLLKEVKCAYYFAIALSSYEIESRASFGIRPLQLESYQKARAIAVAELDRLIEQSTNQEKNSDFQVLFCRLHLLFCDIFEGRSQWKNQIQLAAELLNGLIANQDFSKEFGIEQTPKPTGTITSAASTESPLKRTAISAEAIPSTETITDTNTLKNDGPNALKIIVGSFIAFDILSSASTRTSPLLTLNHEQILKALNIPLEEITGCNSQVMLLIHRISTLDTWKSTSIAARTLSIMELSTRATAISHDIESYLLEHFEDQNAIPWSPKEDLKSIIPSPSTSQLHASLTSRIFALAGLTYLHVVVSGAFPELPEIRDSVRRTMQAIEMIPYPRLLASVVWPICITGCLSAGGDMRGMLELEILTNSADVCVGGLRRGFEVVTECWKVREEGTGPVDWVIAMRQRGGNDVPLF